MSNKKVGAEGNITSTPTTTIGKHELMVITLRISGWSSPCKVTKLANMVTISENQRVGMKCLTT